MIFQIIGMLIVFCAVMLLMSLIVSSCVQLIQKLANWRQKNLILGLQSLSQYVEAQVHEWEGEKAHSLSNLHQSLQDAFLQQLTPVIGGSHRWLSYRRSEITVAELTSQIEAVLLHNGVNNKQGTAELCQKAGHYFSRIEVEMRFRFRRLTHISVLFFTVILVVLFQLDAIEIIEKGMNLTAPQQQVLSQTIQETCSIASSEDQQLLCLANALMQSNMISFTVLPDGIEYYVPISHGQLDFLTLISRLFGLLCSVVLISLGSPFWFERLKSIFVLKEGLKIK